MRRLLEYASPKAVSSISIHAPVKGATEIIDAMTVGLIDFNPRTREGCDKIYDSDVFASIRISIHAPVKGATTRVPVR